MTGAVAVAVAVAADSAVAAAAGPGLGILGPAVWEGAGVGPTSGFG